MVRIIALIICCLLVGCSAESIQQGTDLAKRIEEERKKRKEEETTPTPPIALPVEPTPAPIVVPPSPTPIPKPLPAPRACADTDKLVRSHHGPHHDCRVGGEKRGCPIVRFTGAKGGLECLASNDSDVAGELKCGLPWNYDCSLSKEVKVCGPKGCKSAENSRAAWANYDSTPNGNKCTQWHRWRQSATRVFQEIGTPVVLHVGTCRVNWCTAQWKREGRCS